MLAAIMATRKSDREQKEKLVHGYCRRDIGQSSAEILDLCYQLYFVMYLAKEEGDLKETLGAKLAKISKYIKWNEPKPVCVNFFHFVYTDFILI